MNRRPIIILLFLSFLIVMSAAPADADVDFSGEWSGQLYSISYDMRVDFFLSLTQDGNNVTGTFTIVGAICGPIEDFPLNGTVKSDVLSFQASGHCRGEFFYTGSQGELSGNKLTGVGVSYEDGEWHGESEFVLTRTTHTITAATGSGGTITPNGETSVNAGTDQTFTIIPDSGYEILNVLVDGVSMGAISSHTFSDVSANHTISATFQLAQKRATVSGTVSYNGQTLCAMALANGQYMFTCKAGDDFGKYELNVPLDSQDQITIQAFVSGMAPFRQTTDESDLTIDIDMQKADPESQSPDVTAVNESDASTPDSWARITGTVTFGGESLCAMVLANGQYMFSCGANDGVYDLTVPLDGNGQITLYVFVSGKRPYKRTFKADGSIITGDWSGSAGFGTIDFVVESDSAGLESITITFDDFKCGNATLNGSIKQSGSSLEISDDTLSTVISLDPGSIDGDTIEIYGEFDDNGSFISGTYEAHISGSICSGTWNASPQ